MGMFHKVMFVMMLANFVYCSRSDWVPHKPQVPCYFIFGDSLADPGNNNFLSTTAKANYPPYGIDFPFHVPTGRFGNGRTTVDIIGQLMGLDDFIPPFATARGRSILKGVNYASGSAGIRNETGSQLGHILSFDAQLQNYQTTVRQISAFLGHDMRSTYKYLSKCIYLVSMGSNDYGNNYYYPQYHNTSRQYTVEQYAVVLLQQYSRQIKTLYDYGARKVVLPGITPLGCLPFTMVLSGKNSCVESVNDAVRLFNKGLILLVDELNNNLNDAKFTYINSYDIFEDMLTNPSTYGFGVTDVGCCTLQQSNNVFCDPFSQPCIDRSKFLFYDALHLTEAANKIIARRSYTAHSPLDTYPIDICALVRL